MKLLLKDISNNFAIVLSIIYTLGFLCWNIYLGLAFNYFEHDLLQVRFLSAGLCCLLFGYFLYQLIKIANKLLEKVTKLLHTIENNKFFLLIAILVYIYTFSIAVFPSIPQALGGAKPVSKELIIQDEEFFNLLKDFGVQGGENASDRPHVQTKPLCEFYTNNNISIYGVIVSLGGNPESLKISRTIAISNSKILGYDTSADFCPRYPITIMGFDWKI